MGGLLTNILIKDSYKDFFNYLKVFIKIIIK